MHGRERLFRGTTKPGRLPAQVNALPRARVSLGQADENPQGLGPGYLWGDSIPIAQVGVQGRAHEASRPWLQPLAQQPSSPQATLAS